MILSQSSMASRLSSADTFGTVNTETGVWFGGLSNVKQPASWLVESVEFFMFKTGSNGTAIEAVLAQTDVDCKNLNILGSKSIAESNVPSGASFSADGAWVTFTFDTPILVPADIFLLAHLQSAAPSNRFVLPLCPENVDPVYVSTGSNWSGVFGSSSYDIGFRVNGEIVKTFTPRAIIGL